MTDSKLPISAIVTTRNEGRLVGGCLQSIPFCDERVVVDLESSDDSAAVAAANGARVLPHRLVPAVEEIWCELAPELRYDWLLIIDPDVHLSPSLQEEVIARFPTLGEDVAIVSVPTRFYFRGRPLRGTVWGGMRERRLLINRKRATLSPEVHADIAIDPPCTTETWAFTGENLAHHYWMTGYSEWLSKHRRYVREEAKGRWRRGERFSARRTLGLVTNAFYYSFVTRAGYRDRLVGFLLSGFWAWYVGRTQWELRRVAV